MNLPKLEPLPPDVAAFVAAEKARAPDSPERTERVLSRVLRSLSLPPTTVGSRADGAGISRHGVESVSSAVRAKLGGALAAAFLTGASAGAAVYHGIVQKNRAEAPRLETPVLDVASAMPPASSLAVPTAAVGTVSPAEGVVSLAAPPSASTGTLAKRAVRDEKLAQERNLIETARNASARRTPIEAIELLREHEKRFPNGQLSEDRDALLIELLASTGETEEARKRAAAFRARFPHSMLLPDIDAVSAPKDPAP
jgi:hypothetical protein